MVVLVLEGKRYIYFVSYYEFCETRYWIIIGSLNEKLNNLYEEEENKLE